MASRFWVGGGSSTNWDATANTNWAATSGGAGNQSVPTTGDDVFFDANSGVGTSVMNVALSLRSFDCNGYAGTLTHNSAITMTITGNDATAPGTVAFRLASGMTYPLGNSATSALSFTSTSGTSTITTTGKTTGNLTTNGAGGTFSLGDALTANILTVTAGIFTANNQNLSILSFSSSNSNTRTITMGSGTWTIQEMEERKRTGSFLNIELDAPTSSAEIDADDVDAPHCFLEQHRFLDLDEDGYREPYIVTVHKDSCKVVRIVANYRVEDIKDDGKRITRIPRGHYFVKYSFIPDPKGGFYDIGFGALLESLGETIDTVINQMLDAGHLQNAGGGLIASDVRFKKNKLTVSPGKFEQVGVNGDIRQKILHHQFAGPSPVLFNLLGMMIEAARDITAGQDSLTGDSG